jgi:hypothetical protein
VRSRLARARAELQSAIDGRDAERGATRSAKRIREEAERAA